MGQNTFTRLLFITGFGLLTVAFLSTCSSWITIRAMNIEETSKSLSNKDKENVAFVYGGFVMEHTGLHANSYLTNLEIGVNLLIKPKWMKNEDIKIDTSYGKKSQNQVYIYTQAFRFKPGIGSDKFLYEKEPEYIFEINSKEPYSFLEIEPGDYELFEIRGWYHYSNYQSKQSQYYNGTIFSFPMSKYSNRIEFTIKKN